MWYGEWIKYYNIKININGHNIKVPTPKFDNLIIENLNVFFCGMSFGSVEEWSSNLIFNDTGGSSIIHNLDTFYFSRVTKSTATTTTREAVTQTNKQKKSPGSLKR